MNYILFIIVVIFFLWIFIVLKYLKKKKLDKSDKKEILKFFSIIKNKKSSKEKIIDYDKLYHRILLKLGFKWSFWEILKSEPRVIENLNQIWELHKLRNNLVHSFDNISEKFLNKKAEEYEKIIRNLLKII